MAYLLMVMGHPAPVISTPHAVSAASPLPLGKTRIPAPAPREDALGIDHHRFDRTGIDCGG
jgi:hypothetical protein